MKTRDVRLGVFCDSSSELSEFTRELCARLGRRGFRASVTTRPPASGLEAILSFEASNGGDGVAEAVEVTVYGRSSFDRLKPDVSRPEPTGPSHDLRPADRSMDASLCDRVDEAVSTLQNMGLIPSVTPQEWRDEAILWRRLKDLGYL